MKIYSTLNPRPVHVSENSGDDIVIPDDSLSVIEIISRYQRGLPTDIHERPMIYDDDQDLDDPDNFDVDPLNEFNDLSDIYDMSEELLNKKFEESSNKKENSNSGSDEDHSDPDTTD